MRIKINQKQLKNILKECSNLKENDSNIKVGQTHSFFTTPQTKKVWSDIVKFMREELLNINDDTTYLWMKSQLMRYYNSTTTDKMIEDKVIPYFKDKLQYKLPSNDVKSYQSVLGTTSFVNTDGDTQNDSKDGYPFVSTIKTSIPLYVEVINRIMKGRNREYTIGMNKKEMERNKQLVDKGQITQQRKSGEKKVIPTPNLPKTSNIGVGTQSVNKG